jgi:hypothetical protein
MAPSCFMKVSMQTANPALHLTRRNVGLDSRRAFKSLFPVRHASEHHFGQERHGSIKCAPRT